MEITEIRILPVENNSRLKGFATVVFADCFCVNDIKIINGSNGLFIAMPSRKISDYCECGGKNILFANFCNKCGKKLASNRGLPSKTGSVKYYSDIVHPITPEFRQQLQTAIIRKYRSLSETATS